MVTIERKLRPWRVPSFASTEEAADSVRLTELPQSTLDEMAAEWLSELYWKAGKQSNWKNMG